MSERANIAELRRGVEIAEQLRSRLARNVATYGSEAYKIADEIEKDLRGRLAEAIDADERQRKSSERAPSVKQENE